MGLFGQSEKDVQQLIRDRDNGWVACHKCGHLVSKADAKHILKDDSSGRTSFVYFGKSCEPVYDRIAYMPGGNWYFKKAEKPEDERVNEDGSSYYEAMQAKAAELHTAACRAHCNGPDCPCDGCIGMFSKPPLNMNDEVKFTSSVMGHSHPNTSVRQPGRSDDYNDLQKAKRLLKKIKSHIEEIEQSWGGAYCSHTDHRGKTNHELACEVRSFFSESN